MWKIALIFVAFSEKLNFTCQDIFSSSFFGRIENSKIAFEIYWPSFNPQLTNGCQDFYIFETLQALGCFCGKFLALSSFFFLQNKNQGAASDEASFKNLRLQIVKVFAPSKKTLEKAYIVHSHIECSTIFLKVADFSFAQYS